MRGSERIHIAQATLHTANYRARYRYRFIFWALGFAVPSVRVPGPRLVYCSFLWMWFGSPVGGAANDSRVSTATDLRELFLACHSASCVYRTAHVVCLCAPPPPGHPHRTPRPDRSTGPDSHRPHATHSHTAHAETDATVDTDTVISVDRTQTGRRGGGSGGRGVGRPPPRRPPWPLAPAGPRTRSSLAPARRAGGLDRSNSKLDDSSMSIHVSIAVRALSSLVCACTGHGTWHKHNCEKTDRSRMKKAACSSGVYRKIISRNNDSIPASHSPQITRDSEARSEPRRRRDATQSPHRHRPLRFCSEPLQGHRDRCHGVIQPHWKGCRRSAGAGRHAPSSGCLTMEARWCDPPADEPLRPQARA